MHRYLELLKLAMALMPWIHAAEDKFSGQGKGLEKKQWILDTIAAGGDALMVRFGVPQAQIDEFHELASQAIDLAVHLLHFTSIFKAERDKLNNSHLALAQPPLPEQFVKPVEQTQQ
jgi:hypothetical protein